MTSGYGEEVYVAVMAVGPPAWDVDLDMPGVLEERLSEFMPRVRVRTRSAAVIPLRGGAR